MTTADENTVEYWQERAEYWRLQCVMKTNMYEALTRVAIVRTSLLAVAGGLNTEYRTRLKKERTDTLFFMITSLVLMLTHIVRM
jgi:hypothetical protein